MSADLQQPPPQQLHPQQQASSPSQAQCGQKKRAHRFATCYGCRSEILDQYILQVAPDMEWHASCLKCAECQQSLDENCTCFVKEKRTYCKNDYMRLFAAKCCKCAESFNKNDFVMRARNKIYHPDCFCCESCSRQLVSGDEFALRDEHLFCKLCIRDSPPGSGPFLPQEQPPPPPPPQLTTLQPDTDVLDSKNNSHHSHFNHPFVQELTSPSPSVPTDGDINGNSISPLSSSNSSSTNGGNNHHHHHQNGPTSGNTKLQLTGTSDAPPMQTSSRHRESVRHVHKQNSEHKPTRVRTVLNERQLQTLRSCYQANPRPDALMKEQLVEVTGLSPRVIRVWFQNKRCKDKKRSLQMKMLQQQEKDGRQLHNIANMRGVPLVATSPVRHESPVQHPLEVQSYHPPWKAFADYALQHEADPNAPHFQHLVNQMHGYDVSLPPGPPGPGSDSHLVQLQNGPCTPLSYLADHELHNSNMSQIPGTPSEMSSPCTSD